MSGYLRVTNFWRYQNADVWKKCHGHPPWFKHYVARDRELDRLPVATRLLWVELLASASRNSNVLEDDLNWLSSETRMTVKDIREGRALLLKGGWLSQSRTARRSRIPSRKVLEDPLPLEESRLEKELALGTEARSEPNGLPFDKELILLRLMAWIGNDADAGTKDTIRGVAAGLPPSSLAKVLESALSSKPRQRARYAVGALNSERKEQGR